MAKIAKRHVPAGYTKARAKRHTDFQQKRSDKDYQAFYRTAVWRTFRAGILRAEPLCRECGRHGRVRRAAVVHHLREIKDRWDLRLDSQNVEPVCQSCHNRFNARSSNRRRANRPVPAGGGAAR